MSVAAIALIAIAGNANAACPDGADNYAGGVSSFPFSTTGLSFAIDTPLAEAFTGESYADYDSDCHTPVGIGIGESTTGEIVDIGGGAGAYSHGLSITAGPNNSAFGNNSSVYTQEAYTHPGPDGLLGTADDEQRTRIIPVSDGTAVGANSHVGHDHSTAIGADAESTDDHQVTLGTESDTIKAKGVTTAKAKARQVGPVELVTTDSEGRLATDGGATHAAISNNTAKNVQQDNRLDGHDTAISNNAAAIQDNADLLSTHGNRLDDLDDAASIALAMPDAWLGDSKSFGIFGSVGGFNGNTALGFAAIGRINETWSINGKLGADTDFDNVGWQVGAGAQW